MNVNYLEYDYFHDKAGLYAPCYLHCRDWVTVLKDLQTAFCLLLHLGNSRKKCKLIAKYAADVTTHVRKDVALKLLMKIRMSRNKTLLKQTKQILSN